jgi:hypothetical protein
LSLFASPFHINRLLPFAPPQFLYPYHLGILPLSTPCSALQTQECLEKYQELKTGKKLVYVIYGLSEDKRSIVVLKTSDEKDYDKFVGELPEKECRWAVYDFEYTLPGGEGVRNKLCFIMW